MAVYVGMLPKELQDIILQNYALTQEDSPYEKIRDQIMTVVQQKLTMYGKAVPMGVDGVEEGDDEWEVDPVTGQKKPKGKGRGKFQGNCNNCGRFGHRAADCWKPKKQGTGMRKALRARVSP